MFKSPAQEMICVFLMQTWMKIRLKSPFKYKYPFKMVDKVNISYLFYQPELKVIQNTQLLYINFIYPKKGTLSGDLGHLENQNPS